jgi:hypothetical protein
MFKMIKWYVLSNFFQRIKTNLLVILIALLLLIVFTFLMNDIATIAKATTQLLVILIKWSIILCLLFVIIYNLIKLFVAIQSPFQTESNQTNKTKKQFILEKDQLKSKRDHIFEKYTEPLK